MRILLALFVLSIATTTASAAVLPATIVLAQSNIETFDPRTFTAGPNVDNYHVLVSNPNDGNVTSLELNFPGTFQNFNYSPLSFRDDTRWPTLGPNEVAESFFLLPPGSNGTQLAVGTIDDETGLFSSYTLPGDTPLIQASSPGTVVAVLAVLTGTVPDATRFSGRAAIDGAFHDIRFPVPEPTTAFLALLGVASLALRRPR